MLEYKNIDYPKFLGILTTNKVSVEGGYTRKVQWFGKKGGYYVTNYLTDEEILKVLKADKEFASNLCTNWNDSNGGSFEVSDKEIDALLQANQEKHDSIVNEIKKFVASANNQLNKIECDWAINDDEISNINDAYWVFINSRNSLKICLESHEAKTRAAATGENVLLGSEIGEDGNLVMYYAKPDGTEFTYVDNDK